MIHPLAHVENSTIGEGTKVWQFASVIRGAVIGEDCNVASCSIVDGAKVGHRCLIGHGAQLHPGTRIAKNCFIGPGVIFCNDRWPRVGKDCFDVDKLLNGEVVTIDVEEDVSIGAGAVILPGVKVGKGSMIAAGARVVSNVPPFSIWKRSGVAVPIMARKPERMREAV